MIMEPARRLAILCSHLSPFRLPPDPSSVLSSQVSGTVCASASDGDKQVAHAQNQNLQDDCVFCKIIRGESPAWKEYAQIKSLNLCTLSEIKDRALLLEEGNREWKGKSPIGPVDRNWAQQRPHIQNWRPFHTRDPLPPKLIEDSRVEELRDRSRYVMLQMRRMLGSSSGGSKKF